MPLKVPWPVKEGCSRVGCHDQCSMSGLVTWDEGVGKLSPPRVPQDVVEVVGAVQAEGEVGVSGRAVAAGMHQVVVEGQFVGDHGFLVLLHQDFPSELTSDRGLSPRHSIHTPVCAAADSDHTSPPAPAVDPSVLHPSLEAPPGATPDHRNDGTRSPRYGVVATQPVFLIGVVCQLNRNRRLRVHQPDFIIIQICNFTAVGRPGRLCSPPTIIEQVHRTTSSIGIDNHEFRRIKPAVENPTAVRRPRRLVRRQSGRRELTEIRSVDVDDPQTAGVIRSGRIVLDEGDALAIR